MFLYELALELDVRSADLVAAAARRGIDGLTSASRLRPDQEELLRVLVAEVGPIGLAGLGGGRPRPLDAGGLGLEPVAPPTTALAAGRARGTARRLRRRRTTAA